MGYNKVIKYAKTLETYTYEKQLPFRPRTRRSISRKTSLSGMASHGSTTLRQDEFKEKRRDNARCASLVFRRLVSANLDGTHHPLLIAFTYAENETSLKTGYKDFGAFIQALRYKFGKQFRYIAVPEFQTRGAVHFHALFWGLPDTITQEERHSRLVAGIWGHGYVDVIQTDGDQRISSYLAKYMAKAFTDHRLMGQKAYTRSRNLIKPEIVSGIGNYGLEALLEEIGVDKPEIDKTYDTLRLGKGRHRIYKLD